MDNFYDFIAIGDTVTDAFIRLKDAAVTCDINREKCMICLRFKDKIPYESVTVVPAVGNSANASVSAARLGLKSALVSNIGDDYFGKECLDALIKEKVATEFVKIHKDQKTNYHYVLWYEDDRTILIKHEEFEYSLPEIGSPRWIYFSS
jgi:sugar/nucleoside kinase (ribokinase family)